jgi:hypothetical protein
MLEIRKYIMPLLPKAKLVKSRAGRAVLVATLERHAHKKKGTKTGLSAEGIAAARKKGISFPKTLKSKAYASTVERAAYTARFGQTRARSKKRKTYERVRDRSLLSLDCIRNMDALVTLQTPQAKRLF